MRPGLGGSSPSGVCRASCASGAAAVLPPPSRSVPSGLRLRLRRVRSLTEPSVAQADVRRGPAGRRRERAARRPDRRVQRGWRRRRSRRVRGRAVTGPASHVFGPSAEGPAPPARPSRCRPRNAGRCVALSSTGRGRVLPRRTAEHRGPDAGWRTALSFTRALHSSWQQFRSALLFIASSDESRRRRIS